ncbi:MAG: hypothetical protein WAZ77_03295 [Candidatus Nitrosopolaris sp.]|jgi:hypothetical protein
MKDIFLLVDTAIMDHNIEGRNIGPIDTTTKLGLAERILTKISNEMEFYLLRFLPLGLTSISNRERCLDNGRYHFRFYAPIQLAWFFLSVALIEYALNIQ